MERYKFRSAYNPEIISRKLLANFFIFFSAAKTSGDLGASMGAVMSSSFLPFAFAGASFEIKIL